MINPDLKTKTILQFDPGGNFSYVSETLAKKYGRVLYYCPYEGAFIKHNSYIVGEGIPGVERIHNVWDYFEEVDIWYFSNLHFGSFQEWLRNRGCLVFGSGRGEDMELYRGKMKKLQKELDMPLNEYEEVEGVSKLREYLKDKENLWVKIDLFRGDNVTFHFENMELCEEVLLGLESDLGANKENQLFIVEKPIENAIEYGYDGFCIDGRYPDHTVFGIEVKDSAYAGVFTSYDRLPNPVKEANEKLSPVFNQYGYRGWYSNEMRAMSKNKAVLTDMTCRQPEPPTSLIVELLEDFPLYVWQVAYGYVPNVKAKYKYGVQIVIKSEWAMTKPQPISFPEKYNDFVKIKNLYIENGVRKFVPADGIEMCECGAVIGMGNTLNEAINNAKKIAKEVKGYNLKINGDALDEAQAEVDKLTRSGIKIF